MIITKKEKVSENISAERFDIMCTKLFPELSRKQIKIIIDNGGAYLNKKRTLLAKTLVKSYDIIELHWQKTNAHNEKTSYTQIWTNLVEELKHNIIAIEKNFIIINKPAGMPSQATLDSIHHTVIAALNEINSEEFKLDELFLVHRLDKDTSGIMIIARNKNAQNIFDNLFKEHKIQKEYHALCFYIPDKDNAVINYNIAVKANANNTYEPVFTQKTNNHNAKVAITEYQVIKKFTYVEASLIKCLPKTGRTHQIRVHLMAIGCPIVGDKTYAQNICGHKLQQVALRHMLHAYSISFIYESRSFYFEAPYYHDFENCLEYITKQNLK